MVHRFTFCFLLLSWSLLAFAQAENQTQEIYGNKERPVNVALLQQPRWAEGKTPREIRSWQMEWITKHLNLAGQAKADIACLGEGTVNMEGLALPDCAPVDRVRNLAKKHSMYIIFPVVAAREGIKRNTAILVGRHGSILGYYDKVHPTQTERERGVVPGDDFPVFELDFGNIGVQICHDLSFPESSRVLFLRGAELVFWPTWWSGWGQELDWIVIRSRAIDNDAYLAVVSRGIQAKEGWRPRDPIGRSGIVNPHGQTVSNIGYAPGLIVTEIDLGKKRIAPGFSSGETGELFRESVLKDRNPAAYRILDATQ